MPTFRANRQAVRIGGCTGRFWDTGDVGAPVVVLLPSQLARGQAYLRTANAIAGGGLRVFVVEMPGSGGGSRLEAPWVVDDYAAWLWGFLEWSGLERVTLVGHSQAGATALEVAADYPGRVAGLVLNDAVGARVLGSIAGVIARHTPEFPFEYWFNWRAGPDLFHNLFVHWGNFWAQIRSAVGEVLIERARRVRVPTLLAWGAHDVTVPVDCVGLFRAAIPHAEVYLSAEGRHDWVIERPGEFSAMVAGFVGQRKHPARPLGPRGVKEEERRLG